MRSIIGRKLGMTQIFKDGEMMPVTAIEAGPCAVLDIKKPDKHGYAALLVGFEDIKKNKLIKPELGIFEKAKVSPKKYIKELKIDESEVESYKPGDTVKVDIFKPGEQVDVSGISKGKGFQGVVKKYGFKGFPGSHGSRYHRAGGSIGASASPSKVFKGKNMPGQMGNRKVTVQNLEIVEIDTEKNLIFVKGSVPGAVKSLVLIKEAERSVVKNA